MTRALSLTWIMLAAVLLAACGENNRSVGGGGGSPGGPLLGAQQCDQASDSCVHTHSELFAISHAYVDPDNTVYYRVTVPAWSTGTNWGDGTNGFFYRATVTGNGTKTSTYVPFNGASVGADNRPMLPQFIFIVPADVSQGEAQTTLSIDACATDCPSSTSTQCANSTPPCTKTLWTDTYGSLPVPAVGFGPADDPFNVFQGPNILFDSATGSAAEIPNNGVYPVPLLICPTAPGSSACANATTYTAEQLQWIYDHLLFFDSDGKPYTNDIFADSAQHRSIGVLTIDEAAYPVSGNEYRTRYGSPSAFTAEASPEKQFFFYTHNGGSTAITVGVQLLYDNQVDCGDASCRGCINNVGCGSPGASGPSISPAAALTPRTEQRGGVTAFPANQNLTAGIVETRTINFQPTNQSALCTAAVNPLAISSGGQPVNLPNYVIERTLGNGNWAATFPPALYYVLPAGFGNCFVKQNGSLTSNAPFCDRGSNYVGYVPHYTDTNGNSGTLNGGSTDQALVQSFTLADQYEVGNVSGNGVNSLVWFDNCGYGYTYEECTTASGVSCSVTLGVRKTLGAVSLPSGRSELPYSITNQLPQAVVFGKECCASLYQENDTFNPPTYEPPQQIDNGFGVFISGPTRDSSGALVDATLSYTTIFNREYNVVYDAASGRRLFKIELGGTGPALYRCADQSLTMAVSGTNPVNVALGGSGANAVGCVAFPTCPLRTSPGTEGDYVTCTAEQSEFVLGVQDWVEQRLFGVSSVQLRAWGGSGPTGSKGSAYGGAAGGAPGFTLTVLRPNELPEALYVYAGQTGDSTVVSNSALSSHPIDFSTLPPDPGPIYLIAGGGGKGGDGGNTGNYSPGKGGPGAVAIADSNPVGSFVSTAGGDGLLAESSFGGADGGGGNKDGLGTGGSRGDYGGQKGSTGGNGIGGGRWNTSGALIPPTSWSDGKGGNGGNHGGDGGGGFGGGGGGAGDVENSGYAGGGGGGSWAAGNTVYDQGAPKSLPSSPASGGVFQIAYLPNPSASCTLISNPQPAVRCTFASSQLPLDVSALQDEIVTLTGRSDLPFDDVPVSIETWGGAGGTGGSGTFCCFSNNPPITANGGGIGLGGYARTTTTFASLLSVPPYLYVGGRGANGSNGGEVGGPGEGGAATLVLSGTLGGGTQMSQVLLIAGGGGGGGQGRVAVGIPYDGKDGGQGGIAAATIGGDASGSGTPSLEGGGDGVGACSVGDIGSRCGTDGIGGRGSGGKTGWVGVSSNLSTGQGGSSRGGTSDGGAGGGGFGGGETGDAGEGRSGSGGGGGSWARQATVDDTGFPYLGSANPPATDSGTVALTFALCAVYPEEFSCN